MGITTYRLRRLGELQDINETEEEPEEEETHHRNRFQRGGSKKMEEEPELEEENNDKSEEEPTPRKSGMSRGGNKAPIKNSGKKSQECPEGFEFGKDGGEHDECDTCDLWNECLDAKESK